MIVEGKPKTIMEILKWVQDGSIYLEEAETLLKQAQSEAITKTVKMAVEIVRSLSKEHYNVMIYQLEQLTPERVMGEK